MNSDFKRNNNSVQQCIIMIYHDVLLFIIMTVWVNFFIKQIKRYFILGARESHQCKDGNKEAEQVDIPPLKFN